MSGGSCLLLGDKTLQQQIHAGRIYFCDSQDIAHRGIGGASPALAENPAHACISDDIFDSEKIVLEPQLTNQDKLFLNLLTNFRRSTSRPATPNPDLCQRL